MGLAQQSPCSHMERILCAGINLLRPAVCRGLPVFSRLSVIENAKVATCRSDDFIEYCDSAKTCVTHVCAASCNQCSHMSSTGDAL